MRVTSMLCLLWLSAAQGSDSGSSLMSLPDDCTMVICQQLVRKGAWLKDDVSAFKHLSSLAQVNEKYAQLVRAFKEHTHDHMLIDMPLVRALSQPALFAAMSHDTRKTMIVRALHDLTKQGNASLRGYGIELLERLIGLSIWVESRDNPDQLILHGQSTGRDPIDQIKPDVEITFLEDRYESLDHTIIQKIAQCDVIKRMCWSEHSFSSYVVCCFDNEGVLHLCVFHGPSKSLSSN